MHTVVLANLAYFSLDRICASIPVLKRAERDGNCLQSSRNVQGKRFRFGHRRCFAYGSGRVVRFFLPKRDANGLPRR